MPTASPPVELTAAQLIGALAHSVASLGPRTKEIGGRISFLLMDDDPHAYLLDLDRPGGAWIEGHDAIAVALQGVELSTAVIAKTHAFRTLLIENGAVAQGDATVAGDVSKLARLGEMISGSGSIIDQRARANTAKKKRRR